jgi:hypothetical protein
VKALVRDKICTTWHTYTLNNNRILKRTKWYLFDCWTTAKMSPQVEEQIEKLDWYTPTEAKSSADQLIQLDQICDRQPQ